MANTRGQAFQGDSSRKSPGSMNAQDTAQEFRISPPVNLAMRLQSDRLQDQRALEQAGEDEVLGDDSVPLYARPNENTKPLLELDTPSPYEGSQNSAIKERARQSAMLQVRNQFFPSGGAGLGQDEQGKGTSSTQENKPQKEALTQTPRANQPTNADRYQRFRSAIARAKQQAEGAGKAAEEVKNLEKELTRAKRFYSMVVKLFSAFTAEAILPLIWLIITLNIESINILLFRKKLPESVNTPLNLMGLNISVDKNNPFTPSNLLILGITCLINLFGFIFLVLVFAQILFIIIVMTELLDLVQGIPL